MNDQTWIFGKAISPLFADRVTNYINYLIQHQYQSLYKMPIKRLWDIFDILWYIYA